jgi:hypothetical protein
MSGRDAAGPSPFEARRRGEHLRVTGLRWSELRRASKLDPIVKMKLMGFASLYPSYELVFGLKADP